MDPPPPTKACGTICHDEILEKQGSQEPRWFYGGKGALAGLISQLPAVALALVSLLLPAEGAGRILRLGATGWYYMFKRLMDTWPQAWIWILPGRRGLLQR